MAEILIILIVLSALCFFAILADSLLKKSKQHTR